MGFLDPNKQEKRAVHIETANEFYDWSLEVVGQKALSENWRSKNSRAVKRFESSGNRSKADEKLLFVRVANAAKVGMMGILRPLMMMGHTTNRSSARPSLRR